MSEKDIRHWFIQKPTVNNVPIFENAAQFCEFAPTISQRGCEWIKVFSADDIHKKIGMGLSRYVFIMEENANLQSRVKELSEENERLKEASRYLLETVDFFARNENIKNIQDHAKFSIQKFEKALSASGGER